MEFTITCPVDGLVEVGIEDIDTVVLREYERADITFLCPHCGTPVTVTAIVPAFLLAALDALAREGVNPAAALRLSVTEVSEDSDDVGRKDAYVNAYCEYFRRQLNMVNCVEDALAEIDSRTPSL